MMVARAHRVLTCLLLAGAVVFAMPTVAQAGSPITGAGSTWSAVAIDQWRADVARFGLAVNYTANGSSAGRAFFASGSADFAVSEIPFEPNEHVTRPYEYLPIVAGGTSLMYNLADTAGKQISNLNLSSTSASGIFTGNITMWNDPAIEKDNPHLDLPANPIVPVVRSDGSGTSAQFSAYINAEQHSEWTKFSNAYGIHDDHTSYWPAFPGAVGQNGSDGVANFVSSYTGANSITYVETAYAIQRRFPVANLLNASGHYVQPTAQNVATALTHATFNKDGTQNLGGVYAARESNAYSMSSYSYMIAPTKGFDPAKGATLGAFILYFACDGQNAAAALGYSPLPPNLVEGDFQAVTQIPGAPAPPSTTGKCTAYSKVGAGGGGTGASPTASPTPGAQKSSGPKIAKVHGGSGAAPTTSGGATVTDPAAVLASTQAAEAPKVAVQAAAGLGLLGIVFGPMFLKRKRQQ